MKRALCFILAVMMAVVLFSCVDDKETEKSGTVASEEITVSGATNEQTETTEQTETEEPKKTTESGEIVLPKDEF